MLRRSIALLDYDGNLVTMEMGSGEVTRVAEGVESVVDLSVRDSGDVFLISLPVHPLSQPPPPPPPPSPAGLIFNSRLPCNEGCQYRTTRTGRTSVDQADTLCCGRYRDFNNTVSG